MWVTEAEVEASKADLYTVPDWAHIEPERLRVSSDNETIADGVRLLHTPGHTGPSVDRCGHRQRSRDHRWSGLLHLRRVHGRRTCPDRYARPQLAHHGRRVHRPNPCAPPASSTLQPRSHYIRSQLERSRDHLLAPFRLDLVSGQGERVRLDSADGQLSGQVTCAW